MKKALLIFTIITSSALVISCNQASKKDLKNANDNFKAGNKDLKDAAIDADSVGKSDAKADWAKFKAQSDSSILAMNKRVDTIKLSIAKTNKRDQKKLAYDLNKTREKIDTLQSHLDQQDIKFNKSLSRFDASVKAKNDSFKREFDHDTKELGTALKDIFKDNVK